MKTLDCHFNLLFGLYHLELALVVSRAFFTSTTVKLADCEIYHINNKSYARALVTELISAH